MNNETIPSPSDYSQLVYQEIIQLRAILCPSVLLIYASFLHFSDELEYIWRQKFTLPTLLYLFCKYPLFVSQALDVVQQVLSVTSPSSVGLRLCNDLGYLVGVLDIFPLIGVQGLILARTYSLCQGYRPMSIALFITFLIPLGIQFYALSVPNCDPIPADFFIFPIISGISVILSDMLAFMTVIRQIWGLWKLKRSVGLQNNEDLTTSLFRQGTIRFCFVLLITVTGFILYQSAEVIGSSFDPFQNVLSTLVMCEFTLDLRRRNRRDPDSNQSVLSLPALSFRDNPGQSIRSMLGGLHENIIAEMGERDCTADGDNMPEDGLHDDVVLSDLRPARTSL